MTFAQVAEVLQLSRKPRINWFDYSSLLDIIADNFYNGHFLSLNLEEIKRKKNRGYKFPEFNKNVLERFESDPRFAKYFGFDGCVLLIQKCFKKLQRISRSNKSLALAVGSLEAFLEYVVNEANDKFLDEEDPSYGFYKYRNVIKCVTMNTVLKVGGKNFYKINLERYGKWILEER